MNYWTRQFSSSAINPSGARRALVLAPKSRPRVLEIHAYKMAYVAFMRSIIIGSGTTLCIDRAALMDR